MSIAWCFEDQSSAYTEAVLQAVIDGAVMVVPAIWRLEVANSLVVAERRKKVTQAASGQFLDALGQFAIEVDEDGIDRVFAAVMELARRYQLSAYDASYLELAQRLALPLATRDGPLGKVAAGLGLATFTS